jgi:hypothetical protein
MASDIPVSFSGVMRRCGLWGWAGVSCKGETPGYAMAENPPFVALNETPPHLFSTLPHNHGCRQAFGCTWHFLASTPQKMTNSMVHGS